MFQNRIRKERKGREINSSKRNFEDKMLSVVKELGEISVVTEFERKDVSEEKEEISYPKAKKRQNS